MTSVDHSPARLSAAIAAVAAFLSLASSGGYSWSGLGLGGVGFLVVAFGLLDGRRWAVTVGACGLFAGVVAAGVEGSPVVVVLVGVVATVVAWDAGHTAITVGRQLGRAADTARVEAVHATSTVLVGATTAGIGYGLFQTASSGQPPLALVLLLLAALLLASALR
ncbi:MAG: DUF7519 family protein [Halobacteriota archaeon]